MWSPATGRNSLSIRLLVLLQALNSALDEVCAPIHVQRGVIGEVSVSIPWMALLNENCAVDIRGITLEVEFKPPSSANVPGGGSGVEGVSATVQP